MSTPIASIPLIDPNDNLKYNTHNDAIAILEALSISFVLDTEILDPTALSPSEGDLYIVNGTGAGDWISLDFELVQYVAPSWVVRDTFEDFRIYNLATGSWWRKTATNWVEDDISSNIHAEVKNITLPYTLLSSDRNKELIVASGTGNFNIPNTADNTTGFADYFRCFLTLEGTGNVTIQRVDATTTNLTTEQGYQHLSTQGQTVTIRHRTSNAWKVDGSLTLT